MSSLIPSKRVRPLPADAVLSDQVRISQRPGVNAMVRIQGAAFVSTAGYEPGGGTFQGRR